MTPYALGQVVDSPYQRPTNPHLKYTPFNDRKRPSSQQGPRPDKNNGNAIIYTLIVLYFMCILGQVGTSSHQ